VVVIAGRVSYTLICTEKTMGGFQLFSFHVAKHFKRDP